MIEVKTKLLTYASVDWRSGVAVQTAASTLGSEVDVDGEEHIRLLSRWARRTWGTRLGLFILLLLNDLPHRDERLAAGGPSLVGRLDTSRVELERGSSKNLVSIQGATRVALVQADQIGPVQVRNADVASGLAAVLVVDGRDVGESVVGTACGGDGSGEGGERLVRGHDCTHTRR